MPIKKPIILNPSQKQWIIFPDILPTRRFGGYVTRDDETQQRGSFPIGQNVKMSQAETPTVRDGWEVIGTEATDATAVNRAWVFETRQGNQFELKAYSTRIDYWLHGYSTAWLRLLTGLTSALDFGYANIGQTGDITTHSFFGNGTDSFYQFNGAFAHISSTAATTITKSGATTWTAEGFYTTGTRTVIINNTVYTYTGGEGTTTLTGITPDPTGEAVGSLVVQSPRAVSALSSVLSQVMIAHDGRLHARLDTRPSIWNYSLLDNPDDFTTGSLDGDGGTKEVEFGGAIVAFGNLNRKVLALKRRLIKSLDFIQHSTRVDSPRYETIVSADDKSTTLGATNQKSTFSTPYGLVFITPDKRLALLTGITQNGETEYLILSDPIQSVFDKGVHDDAAGIVVDGYLYYAFKQDEDSTVNDTVLRGDMTRRSVDSNGKVLPIKWDTPYIGINANDFTAIYHSPRERNEVHWHSSLNSNTYRFIADKTDGTRSFTSIIRTWSEHFDQPHRQKRINAVFVEIKMLTNSAPIMTLLYDEDGVTSRTEYPLSGDDKKNVFQSQEYNPFGASAFGRQKIGSNTAITALRKYRYEIEVNPNQPFFNVALQLSVQGEAEDFELVRFGYHLVEVMPEIDRKFKKGVS